MRDLYSRLKSSGFDAKFVQNTVFPEWWEDSLAAEPANRAIIETAIARQLGFKVVELRNPSTPLAAPAIPNFRLKRNPNTSPEQLRPWIVVAERLAKLVTGMLRDVPAFTGEGDPPAARAEILGRHKIVNLQSLVAFAWDQGIVVVHVDPERLPESSKRFQGMALFCNGRPIIILAGKTHSPPWLAFHLAHELGHILLGHVKPHDEPLVDSKIDETDNDEQEKEADQFATVILTGKPKLGFKTEWGLTGKKLAEVARQYGDANGIAPGTVALIYGRSTNRWGPAQLALKTLGQDQGAHEIIQTALASHLEVDDAAESTNRFLNCLSEIHVCS